MPLKDINKPGQIDWQGNPQPKKWLRQTSSKDYIIDVDEMEAGEKVYLKDTGEFPYTNIEPKDMQAALNAQYPTGQFRVESHGSARYIRRLK